MIVSSCLYCGHKTLTYVTHRSDNNGILQCEKCHVMMVEKLSDNTEGLYTADYFEKKTGTKNGYTNYLSSPVANLIGKYGFTRLFSTQPGSHLDLGCADGSLMEIFRSSGFSSSGLEISKDAVLVAKSKGLSVSQSNLHAFPATIGELDVITAFDLLEHSDSPGLVLKGIYQHLKDGGYFVFSTLSVKRNDPSEYWFNNSLEHYIYYNKRSLNYILTDVFGKNSFAFVEIEVNGVAEFWGVAKKGNIEVEREILNSIKNGTFDKKDPESGYFVSLFYNQLSKFTESQQVITHFADTWSDEYLMLATFYNAFYQGKYEYALDTVDKSLHYVSAGDQVYWQALSFVRQQYFDIRKKDISTEYEVEINSLREKLFKSRDELHKVKDSLVIGRVIEAKNNTTKMFDQIYIGHQLVRQVIRLPEKVAMNVWMKTTSVLPNYISKPGHQLLHQLRKVRLRQRVTRLFARAPGAEITYHQIDGRVKDSDTPLITIVIPYYNRADTIDETLASLQNQTFIDFEIIIIDDGSSDLLSMKKLTELHTEGLKVTIVSQVNQGVAAARNNGISLAKSEYIICLDSDDILSPTYVEKAVYVLETNPEVSVVTTNVDIFGCVNQIYKNSNYSALELYSNNMVITAAAFRKRAWAAVGGYKSNIGYEDWEFWINLGEKGFWGKLIPEELFIYRTSLQSRFINDKDVHWNNIKTLRLLHPDYKRIVKKLINERKSSQTLVKPETAFINMSQSKQYAQAASGRLNVMITMPWMTFGGAETLITNYCREITGAVNITFVTGLKSDHEWEYKFRDITPNIYHLPNIFSDQRLYIEFVSNYIKTRHIDVLHMVHTGFVFEMLPTLRKKFPKLKIILTLFNDRVPDYVAGAIKYQKYINLYSTDNNAVAKSLESKLQDKTEVMVIPNGIDVYVEYNPVHFDRDAQRHELGVGAHDIVVLFVGRLSQEKNPDVFIKAAQIALSKNRSKNLKFFLIGDGVMRSEVERLVIEADTNAIKWLGYQENVAQFLSAADIFVLPSSIEGFPLSILEAMAMKVVVIASDVGAVSEVIESGKDGYVVQPGSADEIARRIITLVKDGTKLSLMKTNVREKVEQKYSNRVLGSNYTSLYRGLKK